jgi:ATP phosphoribosyltransferase
MAAAASPQASAPAPAAAGGGGGPEIRLGLPKGKMQEGVLKLLADAGIQVGVSERGYRPTISLPSFSVKMLKPQNILEMLHTGTRDIGFGGYDWVVNLDVDVVELLDTGLDPVRVVVAAPDADLVAKGRGGGRELVIASEYERLTLNWIKASGIRAQFVRAFGATESFPPEDADAIVDNTATGSTLQANGLKVIDTILTSSTRLYASKKALADPLKKRAIDEFVLLLQSVLHGRGRKMVEFNVPKHLHDAIVPRVPCMRAPTVAQLSGDAGYAVKVVVKRQDLPELLPRLKQLGALDIIVSDVSQIVL